MEQLYALLLLNQSGFEHQEDYLALLHRLFLANPEDGTLLELEICAGNLKASASLLNGYWAERWFRFPVASFRRFLFACCPGGGFERFWAQKLPALAAPARPLAAGTACLDLMLCRRPFILGDEAQTRAVYKALFREEGQW